MDYERLYEYRHRKVDQSARQAVWVEIASFIHAEMGAPERVLDPAAGRGEFINAVPAVERWAVDQHAYTEGTYDIGVKSIVSDIFSADLPDEYFDGIFVSNFLEHLPDQEAVAAFLAMMHQKVASNGQIVVMGPNYRYCKNEYFDMADHTLAFTHRSIAEHLYAAGFEPERVEPRFLPYSFTGRLPASRALTRRYLRNPIAWRLLGKQFLVTGRR